MKNILILLIANLCQVHAQVQFQEVSEDLGLNDSSYGEGALGGGVSFFDFDNDGWDDITLASQEGDEIRFFKNIEGVFNQIIPSGITNTFETKSVQWVDVDNDGDYDFFATSNGSFSRLFENIGNFVFNEITQEAGLYLEPEYKIFGSSWGDYNNDGLLDLFVSSRDDGSITTHNVLFENNGDFTFTNVTDEVGLLIINTTSFCAAFFDYDNDGYQDIYVANDRDPLNLLYNNEGNDTFAEVGVISGTGVQIDAMSTTIDDYNNDGYLDIYVTNTFEGNAFFQNNGDGTFTDIAPTNGTLMESIGWGAVFFDADNNGLKDLYVSGEISSPGGTLPSAFYYNDGTGNFSIPEDVGFENDLAKNYGNAIGDIDNDGLPDLAVLNFAPENSYLWKNNSTSGNNWLKVKLQGVESNRMGIGSWIEISVNGQKQYNYTLCGEGYLGQNSASEFFGIGESDSIDYIKVTWLSGEVDLIEEDIPINTAVTIVEGSNVLSVPEVNYIINSSIYPNPSKISFNISSSVTILNVSLFDLDGKLLIDYPNIQSEYDISYLPKGIYIVKITDLNGIMEYQKLIIN